MSALPPLGSSPTAEQRIAEELHELESLAAALLAARNALRDKAKNLYTSAQVGDYQASEAELVSAPLRRQVRDLEARLAEAMAADHQTIVQQRQRIAELEEDNLRYRKAHVCTDGCRPNEHLGFIGKGLVAELEAQNADLRKQIEELKQAAPAGCLTVHKLTRQLDVALSQVSALQRRKEELHVRVANLVEWLEQSRAEAERLEALVASRDTALAESRELVAAMQTSLDGMADTVAARETQIRDGRMAQEVTRQELDKARASLRSVTAERDAQQRDKQAAWERLATIERIVRTPAVDSALNTHATPPYAQTLATAVKQVREALKGFS